jgi:predicted RNA binding protein YcfA (HicA-like mRNA interferase family)
LVDIPSMPHLRVVKVFEKLGYRILRQGKHIVMTDGKSVVTIPRHNPVNRWTLAVIIKEAGLTVDEFRKHC